MFGMIILAIIGTLWEGRCPSQSAPGALREDERKPPHHHALRAMRVLSDGLKLKGVLQAVIGHK